MKNVKFPIVYVDGVISYPDAVELFTNTKPVGDTMYATYYGTLLLTEEAPPYEGSWIIEVPAYLRRFDRLCDTPKQATLACDPHPVCQGMMSLALSRVREGIDLRSDSLPVYLGKLVEIGRITEAESLRIPTTPPTPNELFKG